MNSTHSNRSCPQCKQPLPPDAPEGLCPECLMLGALETMPMPEHLKPSGTLPQPGETFGGYRIGRELGRGGMGSVFEAEQLDTGRIIALKLLNHQLDSPEARARFLREGRLAASINHPNSVYVFGTEEIGDMPAISMELVGGGTLEEIVKERGALPVGEAVDMITQVIEGLEAAQEIGVLHRDVKPGNCFRDIDGTVKIGDFGLSISTEARDERHLTMDGTIFGTPAFSSPEQLRGDELNVQSDIYAVGATLFYLLTGRAAFGGKSVAQLFANVLESQAPSPREIRPELPEGLAAIVLRCLRKIPSDRFSSYLELRKALAPFKSDAPVPASPGMRILAGAIDWTVYSCVAMIVQVGIHGGMIIPQQMPPGYMLITFIISLICWTLYFGLLEGRTGYSLGKGLCRLRVTNAKGNPPGFLIAAIRGGLLMLLPALPMWIAMSISPGFVPGTSTSLSLILGFSFYAILGLLFSTMRRRNGFASVIDLATKTRVIRRKSFKERPVFAHEAASPVVTDDNSERIGPYHVLESLSKNNDSEWVVGYDTRLLRKIWIRKVQDGTPSVPPHLRKLGRVGRLRWLAERRESGDNWDAYESPGGDALLKIVAQQKPTWEQMRYWLLDLAEELNAAESDDTLPDQLSLERIWITSSGRAKLLDFSIVDVESAEPAAQSSDELLRQVSDLVEQPLPLHAASLRKNMEARFTPAALVGEIQPLLGRRTSVSRLRRTALIIGCASFPIFITITSIIGIDMMKKWSRENPEIFSLHQVMNYRQALRNPFLAGNRTGPSDELFSIYIAEHYRPLVNSEAWQSTTALIFIQGSQRLFVEKSLTDFPNPTDAQIAEADEAIHKQVQQMEGGMEKIPAWAPLVVAASGFIFYVGLPAILASLICKGGLVMLTCGVAVARPDGTRATRLRCFWRSLVTWSPWVLFPIIMAFLTPSLGAINAVIMAGLLALLAVISVMLPNRSLQDRIAGTCLVAR